jgi:hypothetical protein
MYRLTAAGRKRLQQETSEWKAFVSGVAKLFAQRTDEVK